MKKTIYQFVQNNKLAIAGVSRNKNKWGHSLFNMLRNKGYEVFPINPYTDEINGVRCYRDISQLPEDIENIIITLSPDKSEALVRQLPGSGIRRVWFHKGGGPGTHTQSALEYCVLKGIETIHDLCPLMFFPNAGIHKLHYLFVKLFGMLPKGYSR